MRDMKHVTGNVLAELFGQNVRIGADGRPDGMDCRSVSNAIFAKDSRLAALAKEMHADQPQVFAAAGGYGSRRARAGGIGREFRDGRVAELSAREQEPGMRALPGCETGIFCDGDILGYSTLGAGDEPTVGPALGSVASSVEYQVDSGNAERYQAHYFFWEARDQNNDFEVIPSYLLSASIGGEQQLVGGGGATNGITSAVFALTDIPLDVGWKRFGTTSATLLKLIMGNYIPGSLAHYNFVWWGNVVNPA